MILIVTNADDAHGRLIAHRLKQKGAEVARLGIAEFPAELGLSAWVGHGEPAQLEARRRGARLDFSRIDTVWFRRLALPTVDASLEGDARRFAETESLAHAFSLGATLDDRFCVNPLVASTATDRGLGKVSQLELARRLGFRVPRTLATSDPAAARRFIASCAGGAIYKPFLPPLHNISSPGEPEKVASVYTSRVPPEMLERLDGIRFAPCIFQELVPKRFELRVTVIGHKVFATEIHAQVHAESEVDSRKHYAKIEQTPYFPHQLPQEVEERCLALNKRLGLIYGAIDLILTPEGEYVFLEVNPSGQFLWLEAMTGQPLLENFCELLMQRTPDYRCDAPNHAPGPWREVPRFDEAWGWTAEPG